LSIGEINTNSFNNIGGIAGKNLGEICFSKSEVTIIGDGINVGGITGKSENGKLFRCINYNKISGNKCVGGICGSSKNTVFEECGNETNGIVESIVENSGGIVGYIEYGVDDLDYTVEKCYNYATVKSKTRIGGIVGSAWNTEGKSIVIRNCYNTGSIEGKEKYNGGILGGTYNLYDSTNTDKSKNIIDACYNIGDIGPMFSNQISPKYADVSDSFFLNKKSNFSGYGFGKEDIRFKTTDYFSIYYIFQNKYPDYWCINENNNGYLSLMWQNE